jgi:hypothetical protein
MPSRHAADRFGAGSAGVGGAMVGGLVDRDLRPAAAVVCRDVYMLSRVRSAVTCRWRCPIRAACQTAAIKTVNARRPMFRFTIRDVLSLTVVTAVAVGWWLDHVHLIDEAARLKMDMQMSRAVDGMD